MFDVTAQLVNNQEEIHNSVGKGFLETSVTDWVMKQSSIFKAHKSMFSQILCCASERFLNISNPMKFGRTELQESVPRKVAL